MPLTPQAAMQALRDATSANALRETKHIKDQMVAPDRKFDMGDVRNVAKYGIVRRPGEIDIKYGTYTYCAEGTDVDGDALHIIFVVGPGYAKLITGVRP